MIYIEFSLRFFFYITAHIFPASQACPDILNTTWMSALDALWLHIESTYRVENIMPVLLSD